MGAAGLLYGRQGGDIVYIGHVIKCDGTIYPTNTYIYVDSGTNCTAQNGKDFEFNTWAEPADKPQLNRTTIKFRYYNGVIGMANFKLPHQLMTGELFTYLTGAISVA